MSSSVSDVMTRSVISVREQAQYKDIILVMRERGFSACPVLDADDAVVGVVSEDDLLVKEAYAGSVDNRAVAVGLLDAIRQVGGVVAVRDRLSYAQR